MEAEAAPTPHIVTVAELEASSRQRFIWRTYLHLFAAVVGFALIETVLFQTGVAAPLAALAMKGWWAFLGAFIIGGWAASHFAHTAESLSGQYISLGVYVLLEALIFAPLLYVAAGIGDGIILRAALITLIAFVGLTAVAVFSGKDFSFLGSMLKWGMVLAFGLIGGGMIFGFNLGIYFSVFMVGLAGASILYDTSQVLHSYPEDRYVGAALSLFASLALLFWYVLRILISLASDD